MEGSNNSHDLSIHSFSQHLQSIVQASSPYPSKKQLSSLLNQQNSKIQKLLERQNFLSATLSSFPRYQTTDSEHHEDQTGGIQPLQFSQNRSELMKGITTVLDQNQQQLLNYQREFSKNSDIFKQFLPKYSSQRVSEAMHQKFNGEKLSGTQEIDRNEEELIKRFVSSLYKFTTSKTILSKIVVEFKMDPKDIKRMLKLLKKQVSDLEGFKKICYEERNRFGLIVRVISNMYLRKRYFGQALKNRDEMDGSIHLKFGNILREELKKKK